jgi:hypothetical protein
MRKLMILLLVSAFAFATINLFSRVMAATSVKSSKSNTSDRTTTTKNSKSNHYRRLEGRDGGVFRRHGEFHPQTHGSKMRGDYSRGNHDRTHGIGKKTWQD